MDVDEETVSLADYHSSTRHINNNAEIIETIDVSDYPITKKRSSNVYDKNLCKDNKALTEFINKCILLDQTVGMESIINKVMLPAYVKADAEYKKSEKFERVVTKALRRLLRDPDRKYTHISDIVDTLKLHAAQHTTAPKEKKRVNFVTLSTKVSVKPNEINRKRPMIESSSRVSPKKFKPEVIALNCDDDDVITIDDEANEGVVHTQVEEMDHYTNMGEDNVANEDTIEIEDSQELKIVEETPTNANGNNHECNLFNSNNQPTTCEQENEQQNNEHAVNEIAHDKENLGSNENLNDGNKLLVPQKQKIVKLEKPKLKKKVPAEMTEQEKARRIIAIEARIEKCKSTIAKLDLEEVTDDSENSPYYKCDRLRALIVKLYKELCSLVGEEPPERRKIRLQITEGLPQGPIKRLEKFLNKQIDAKGDTPFPDFSDVIRCVEKANEKDGLGWSKAKVMKEAQAIFSYCGRALQQRRQQREWKHLRAQVRPDEFEADPAERDLELQARLEANRLLARQREAEVFKKFTSMEAVSEPTASTSLHIEEDPSEPDDDSSSDEETEPTTNHNISPGDIRKESNDNYAETYDQPVISPEDIPKESNDNCAENYDQTIVKEEPVEVPINIQYRGDISLVMEISDSESDDDIGTLTF